MSCRHVLSDEAPGLAVCVDCGRTFADPSTADHGVALHECGCGRGLARFVDRDGTIWCGACFSERAVARRQVPA